MAHLCRAVRFVTVFCISLVGLFISAGKAVRAISCHITCKVKRQENNSVLYAAHCVLKKKKVSEPDMHVNKLKCRIDRLLPMFVTGVPVRGW